MFSPKFIASHNSPSHYLNFNGCLIYFPKSYHYLFFTSIKGKKSNRKLVGTWNHTFWSLQESAWRARRSNLRRSWLWHISISNAQRNYILCSFMNNFYFFSDCLPRRFASGTSSPPPEVRNTLTSTCEKKGILVLRLVMFIRWALLHMKTLRLPWQKTLPYVAQLTCGKAFGFGFLAPIALIALAAAGQNRFIMKENSGPYDKLVFYSTQ